mgnify:CR=1 FL=1
MLTPETIRRYFRGPHHKAGTLMWRWHQKGRRWPRRSFTLTYDPKSRTFHLSRHRKDSARGQTFCEESSLDISTVHGFRACLPPDAIAACTAASIARAGQLNIMSNPDAFRLYTQASLKAVAATLHIPFDLLTGRFPK